MNERARRFMAGWSLPWFGFRGREASVIGRPATAEDLVDPSWQPADKSHLVEYLRSSPAALAGQLAEESCSRCGTRYYPALFRFDGERLWSDDVRHSVEHHHMMLPDRWVDAIRARGYSPPEEIAEDTYFRLAPA
jgi:hypothetical protein